MLTGIYFNIVRPGQPLNATCSAANFKALAYGLFGVKSKIAFDKSEYETATEFETRQTTVENIINEQGILAVCQPLDDNEDAPFAYNAERQIFSGSFKAYQNVWRDSKSLGSYRSRTRMGIPMTIKASVDFEYDVTFGSALRELKSDCLSGAYSYEYAVHVPLEEAPLLKARGRLVFLGRLVSPFISSSESAGSPTLDNPYDVNTRTLTVHFAPYAVALIGPTGKEYWRCELKKPLAGSSAMPGAAAPVRTPAPPRPRGSPESWISADDYPASAARDGVTGTTTVTLLVSTEGRVESCSVVTSSGNTHLDETTCRLLQTRARYEPAIGAGGTAIQGSATYSHAWGLKN